MSNNRYGGLNSFFPQKYKKYLPNVFDDSLSLYEQMISVIEFLNTVSDGFNELSKDVSEDMLELIQIVVDLEKIAFPENVKNVLTKWLSDGTLTNIINNDVFNMKLDKTTYEQFKLSTNQQLAEKPDTEEVRTSTLKIPINYKEFDSETTAKFTGGSVAVVGEEVIGKENMKKKSVDDDSLSFTKIENLFNGLYVNRKIQNGKFRESITPEQGVSVVVNIPVNSRIKIVKGASDRFIIGLSTAKPQLEGNLIIVKDTDTVGTPLADGREFFYVDSTTYRYMVIYLSITGLRPTVDVSSLEKLQIDREVLSKNIIKSKNMFDGEWIGGNIDGTTDLGGVGIMNYTNPHLGRVAIVPITSPSTYVISKTKSNIFRVCSSKEYPSNGASLKVLKGSESDTEKSVKVNTEENDRYLIVYASFDYKNILKPFGEPSFMQVEQGVIQTEWETHGFKFSTTSKKYVGGADGGTVTVEQSITSFIDEMNRRAKTLNMKNTTFVEASGSNIGNVSTAHDLIHLGLYALENSELMTVWNQLSYEVDIKGVNPRKYTVNTTVVKPELDNEYHIFGGKSGTGTGVQNLITFVESKDGKDWLMGVVLGDNGSQRHLASKQLYDIAEKKIKGEETATLPFISEVGVVIQIPKQSPVSYIRKGITPLHEKMGATVTYIASITKIMTVLIALDYLDLNEKIEVITSDLVNDADAHKFPVGDVVSVRDMIYGTMLESSNTFATALARKTGERILGKNDPYS